MTFAEYFVVLQRRWRVWISGLVLGLLCGVGAIATAETLYTATATSFVTVAERVDSSGQGEIFQGSQFAVQRVKSYAPLAKSPDVLGPVIDELGLDVTERELAKRVSVTSAPETVLLDVSVEDRDPVRAALTADAISQRLGTVIEDLETARDGGPSNVRVSLARPADVPVNPSSPRVLLNLVLGGATGLALGLVGAVLRHHLDTRVKTQDGVRALTDMSPLGATLYERSAAKRPLVALDWRSASAERYRTVRTALKFATVDRELRHFAVTSAAADEGKTSVACNLAISWAQSGASVCLVEADLRRPSVSRFLGIDGSLGLSDVVVGESRLDDVLVTWDQGLLTVLPAGSLPPDPAALLGSSAMASLVATLRDRFDVVIYDSPPLLSVTDGVVLGHQMDGVVLVIRAFSTRPEQVTTSIERLRSARVDLLGTVLTRERSRRRGEDEYKSELTRNRVELSPRPVETAGPANEKVPPKTKVVALRTDEQSIPKTNGVTLRRVTVIDSGGGCDR
ncbi:polysaccharide biosynthesis tyrosine autokinase [Nocardioides sp.]|uniref:polysaccharide biosynthesis tyrosine autokinase n=1 Tax=Nocardioides sp. TaxID=35761 RepID=UPI0027328935|nr:polysaccharide biosynthesis tyrosine autokinase [Nocardioides sp.]MDP3894953.1 polysaccharide biosynthesis tyrosine autokinase [Nocardioides sp.]